MTLPALPAAGQPWSTWGQAVHNAVATAHEQGTLLSAYGPPSVSPTYRTSAVNSGVSATASITTPAGVLPGDALIALVKTSGSNATLPTTPVGWTRAGSTAFTSGAGMAAVYSRVAGPGEPAAYTWALGASKTWRAQLIVFSGGKPGAVVANYAGTAIGTATSTFTTPAVTLAERGFQMAIIVGENDTAVGTTNPGGGYGKRTDANSIQILTKSAGGGLVAPAQAFSRTAPDTGAAISVAVRTRLDGYANSFESGDLNGFTQSLQTGPAAPLVINDPFTTASRKVAQFDVLSGQLRQELITGGIGAASGDYLSIAEGDDLFFACAYWLAPDWPVNHPTWHLVHQWLSPTPSSDTAGIGLSPGYWGTPKWVLHSVGPATGTPTNGTGVHEHHSLGDITVGAWTKFVFRIKFSSTPASSVVQAWMGVGNERVAKVFDSNAKVAETLWAYQAETRPGWWPSFTGETAGSQGGTYRAGSSGAYEKHGIYRDSAATTDAHLLSAGVRIGPTFASVTV